jgi:hypothetical protein
MPSLPIIQSEKQIAEKYWKAGLVRKVKLIKEYVTK